MSVMLFVLLLVSYLALGLIIDRYTWRVRAVMGVLTFVVPAWVYFLL